MFVCTCRRNSRSYITAGWVGTLETDFLTVYWGKKGAVKKAFCGAETTWAYATGTVQASVLQQL